MLAKTKKRSAAAVAMLFVTLALAASGCQGGDGSTPPDHDRTPSASASVPGAHVLGVKIDNVVPARPPTGLEKADIVYVERVDPDGDGDAHFVIADPQSITLPGLTAIDVRAGLRPHPLPGPGDLISAAGPVQTGSYGQSQIHALELYVAE